MLSVNSLDVDINATPILRDINLNLQSGEIIGLIGRNGAGKTTFLRSLMGLLPSKKGDMRYQDENLVKLPGHKRAHMGFGYMPEDRRLVPEMTAEQNILVPVWSTGIDDYIQRLSWIYKIIPECEKFRDSGATALSGGQQKLVALARAPCDGAGPAYSTAARCQILPRRREYNAPTRCAHRIRPPFL